MLLALLSAGVSAAVAQAPLCTITGGPGNDVLQGTPGDDVVCGLGGDDRLEGLDGNDTLIGGPGNDALVGGAGRDWADYSDHTEALRVWLGTYRVATSQGGERDALSALENVRGGAGDDELHGAPGTNSFSGGPGRDSVSYSERDRGVTASIGDGANDGALGESDDIRADVESIIGAAGGDWLTGDDQANGLYGGPGSDRLYGRGGADLLMGGHEGDLLSGGDGDDYAYYADREEAITVTIGTGADDGAPGEGDDVRSDVENVTGGAANDSLTGNGGANRLYGGPGKDVLLGGGGADRLEGADGDDVLDAQDLSNRDTLNCGAGRDVAFRDALDELAGDCEPDLPVDVKAAEGAQGRVLAGTELRSQVVNGPPDWAPAKPIEPHYPLENGERVYPKGAPFWRSLSYYRSSQLIHAASADATFNSEQARYRLAFHRSHYGGMPDNAGDLNGDGVDDFVVTCHFCFVDGKRFAGEVHVYYGRRGEQFDPEADVPDIVFYGDAVYGKLGLAVDPAGDVNGDGRDDLLISAAYHPGEINGGSVAYGGQIYLVYGGSFDQFPGPVKVRTEDIGRTVPGIVLQGGGDGRRYVGYANGLEAGDFNGDGLSDIVIGCWDFFTSDSPGPPFNGRAYLIYGSRDLPRRSRSYRLGIDRDRDGIRSAVFDVASRDSTLQSFGFGTFMVGDLNKDGYDELAFTVGRGGANGRGAAYLYYGRPNRLPATGTLAVEDADIAIDADELTTPAIRLQFEGLQGARPAGDFNGDGTDDLLLLARHSGPIVDGERRGTVGVAGVLYGRPGTRPYPARMGYSALDVMFYGPRGYIGHPAMDRPADFDGDGRSDLLINDPYYTETIGGDLQTRGRLWLVRGQPNLPKLRRIEPSADLVFLPDNRIPGLFGFTWNTGDWNGDGRPDIVIGDHYAGDVELHEHAGRVHMYYNGSSFRVPAP